MGPVSPALASFRAPRHPKAVARLHQARRLVEEELRRVAVGDRLPPVRELRERCRVGLAQFQLVITTLEEEGFIERRQRSGLYKVRTPPALEPGASVTTIDLVACGRLLDIRQQSKGSFTGEFIESLAAEAGEHGLAIRLRQVFAHESVARYETIAADPSVRGCLLLAPHLSELATLFEHRGVRTVSLFPKQPQTHGVAIVDAPEMVPLQVEHLWALGHCRIGYMHHVTPHSTDMVFLQRREAFYRLMAERGVALNPRWVFRAPEGKGQEKEEAQQKVLAEVLEGPGRPTALIVGDGFAPAVYRHARLRGWCIGRELSVMGTDDLPVASVLDPPLTTVRNERSQVARLAIMTLERLLAGEKAESYQHVPLKLVVRESTGPVVGG